VIHVETRVVKDLLECFAIKTIVSGSVSSLTDKINKLLALGDAAA
jgi:hypothetical protein